MTASTMAPTAHPGATSEYVTFRLADQWIGIPVLIVQEVLVAQRIARVPMAPAAIAGFLNLRGQIVTAVDLRTTLGLPARDADTEFMNVVVRHESELFAFMVEVNRISAEIGNLNQQIVASESGGNTANDLRDARDRLLDSLGSLVPVSVIDRTDGSNQVMLGGRPLVDGTTVNTLNITAALPLEVRINGETSALRGIGGELGALLELANSDIAQVRSSLDDLAAALVDDVNALHVTGWSPTAGGAGNWDPLLGPTGSGVGFFSDNPVHRTAGGIRLSAAVAASASAIAVGGTLNATGDNTVALGIAELRSAAASPLGGSFGGAYQSMIADLAGATRAAADSADVRSTLMQQAESRREAVSGVSTDEELMRLMRHQQAYTAAAKIVQTVDEMMDVLLNLKR